MVSFLGEKKERMGSKVESGAEPRIEGGGRGERENGWE